MNYKNYGHEPLGFERIVAIQLEGKRIYFHIRKDWVKGERKKQWYKIKVDGSLRFIKKLVYKEGK